MSILNLQNKIIIFLDFVYKNIKCSLGFHSWGPKTERSMYDYEEHCKSIYCNAILINSKYVYRDGMFNYYKRK